MIREMRPEDAERVSEIITAAIRARFPGHYSTEVAEAPVVILLHMYGHDRSS